MKLRVCLISVVLLFISSVGLSFEITLLKNIHAQR